MQILKNALIISAVLFFISNSLLAQSDFIVTNHNDTIKCDIKKPLFQNWHDDFFKYRVNPLDGYVTVDSCIKAIFVASDTSNYEWETLPHVTRKLLVKCLEKGNIKLYEWSVKSSTSGLIISTYDRYWYAGKGNDSLKQVKVDGVLKDYGWTVGSRKQRKETFYALLADDPDLLAAFKKENSFDFDAIRNYIQLYNFRRESEKK